VVFVLIAPTPHSPSYGYPITPANDAKPHASAKAAQCSHPAVLLLMNATNVTACGAASTAQSHPAEQRAKRDRLASAHRRVCGEAKMIMVRDFPTIPASSFLACYFGIVQGNSPGWSRARESPLHVEFGSSGGPHHGERSSHQYSPVNMPMKRMKPTSKRTKATIPAVSQL
jgi:hypothetical protein